jgi:uncharacterized membrane protein required for colicin V production
MLPHGQVLHVVGTRDWPLFEAWQQEQPLPPALAPRYHPVAYLHDEMPLALAGADLTVARAGASTLGEFPVARLPSILAPLHSVNQMDNAQVLASRGAAVIVEDVDLPQQLGPTVAVCSRTVSGAARWKRHWRRWPRRMRRADCGGTCELAGGTGGAVVTLQSQVLIAFLLYLIFWGWTGYRRGAVREVWLLIITVGAWVLLQERGSILVRLANFGGKFGALVGAGGLSGENTEDALQALADAPNIVTDENQAGFLFLIWAVIVVISYIVLSDKRIRSPKGGLGFLFGAINGVVFAALLLPILGNLVELSDGSLADAPLQSLAMLVVEMVSAGLDVLAALWALLTPVSTQAWFLIPDDHPDRSGLYAARQRQIRRKGKVMNLSLPNATQGCAAQTVRFYGAN